MTGLMGPESRNRSERAEEGASVNCGPRCLATYLRRELQCAHGGYGIPLGTQHSLR